MQRHKLTRLSVVSLAQAMILSGLGFQQSFVRRTIILGVLALLLFLLRPLSFKARLRLCQQRGYQDLRFTITESESSQEQYLSRVPVLPALLFPLQVLTLLLHLLPLHRS